MDEGSSARSQLVQILASVRRPLRSEFLTMYKPNFCAECGSQIMRARWHFWTSRRFCNDCGRRLRKSRVIGPLIWGGIAFGLGLSVGRSARPAPPPLILMQGQASSFPSTGKSSEGRTKGESNSESRYGPDGTSTERPTDPDEVVSVCGARTKKGSPCSRRVRGTGRCWQHKGLPAMLPPEKLKVAGN